mmetsp:Transcript_24956/g.62250  ORF Transcript_24956/g.62250 Transcript_24956/m.62250 type:complete len:208 (-) Transcript_24956:375-998(-)
MNMAVRPPAAAAMVVHTAERPTTATESAPTMASIDPGLKPYHPTHRTKVPSTTREALWPGMAMGRPSAPKRPVRGPTITAPMSPAKPPTMCTTPEPAKSIMPTFNSFLLLPSASFFLKAESQPSVSQTQCTTVGYTKAVRKKEYPRYAWKAVRSATEPETMVAAAAEKAHWNRKEFQSRNPTSWSPLPSANEPSPMNALALPSLSFP